MISRCTSERQNVRESPLLDFSLLVSEDLDEEYRL